jgi:hypothetical protein
LGVVAALSGILTAATTLPRPSRLISLADRCMTRSIVDAVGTIDIAVHGWDVATGLVARLGRRPRVWVLRPGN